MLTLTCYNSGALTISDGTHETVHLSHQAANRFIMAARMKGIEDFVHKLPSLIDQQGIVHSLTGLLHEAQGTQRWNLKEKIARLHTVVPGYPVAEPEQIKEVVQLQP